MERSKTEKLARRLKKALKKVEALEQQGLRGNPRWVVAWRETIRLAQQLEPELLCSDKIEPEDCITLEEIADLNS